MRRTALITGAGGLIGSEAVEFLAQRGWAVHGVDNNMRKEFFGADGDTSWNVRRLRSVVPDYTHHGLDVRDREGIAMLVASVRPDLIFHCAAQPSHDLAARIPFDDFDVNAVGTLNLLEAARNSVADSPFVFMSTNKVYGDAPNEIPVTELDTRWDYRDEAWAAGIDETMRLDGSMHSLFGASKVAADVMVQEYGRYFEMPTCCFRGGCLTGPQHSGVELHGFLAYLARAVRDGLHYRVFGYGGKQVRDNIHSSDVCEAMLAFAESPRPAAVYNLGGGRANSVSVVEAIERFEYVFGRKLSWEYVDEARRGDHICYISDTSTLEHDFPDWSVTVPLDDVFDAFASALSPAGT